MKTKEVIRLPIKLLRIFESLDVAQPKGMLSHGLLGTVKCY